MMVNTMSWLWMVLSRSLVSQCNAFYRSLLTILFFLVEKPSELDFSSVRQSLMHIVPLCLDSDPSLIPLSCKAPSTPTPDAPATEEPELRDPDDFSFWSERQAKRICSAIKQAFDVEYAPEVVVADANLSALAHRILVSKEILTA